MRTSVTAIIAAVIFIWVYIHTSPQQMNPYAPTEQTLDYEEWLQAQTNNPTPEYTSVNKWAPMNVDRCVALHNEIFRLGCEGMGRNFSDFQPKNWFDEMAEYGAQDACPLLSDEMIAFLERVHANNDWNFGYFVDGLMAPKRIADNLENYETGPGTWQMPKQRKKKGMARFVTLYGMSVNMASHSEGLIFDQETNKAMLCPSIWHGDVVFNGRQVWYPLETVLKYWLDMIKRGELKAVGKESEYEPWALVKDSEKGLRDMVAAFNSLVDAIETRMPQNSLNPETKQGLVDKNVLNSLHVMQYGKKHMISELGLAHAFMSRVRRPRFQYIAPGLSVPTEATIADQPFFNPKILETRTVKEILQGRMQGEFQAPPFLLFHSDLPVPLPRLDYKDDNYPFIWPWNTLKSYHAGLYLHALSDQFAFTLPFGIGAKGYARATDGSRFGERVDKKDWLVSEAEDRYADMYRVGHHPFVVDGSFGLKDVLDNWTSMIERGDWKIGKHGVINDVHEWKQADTAEHWEKYVLALG